MDWTIYDSLPTILLKQYLLYCG